MRISIGKTGPFSDPEGPTPDIYVKGEQLKICTNFKYLCSMVTCDDDIKHSISVG